MSKIKSTEVATQSDNLPVGMTQEDLEALLAQQDAEFVDEPLSTPIFKIGQGLTKEVQAGDAEAGEFIDSLTGDGIGTEIGFITAYYQPGRFAADRESGKAYTAYGATIPPHWAELLGEEWVGTAFVEHPDAEECYKERVNNKEIEWGKGPLISTTHNFTGYAIIPSVDPDEPDELRPARVSCQRTDNRPAQTWRTYKRTRLRGKPFWDIVFDLSTEQNTYKRGKAFNLVVKPGRATTSEEKVMAAELAAAVMAGRVQDNAAEAQTEAPSAAPVAEGGLGV